MTERNRIDVYDLRQRSAAVYTTSVTGIKNLSLTYTSHPVDLKVPIRLEIWGQEGPNDTYYRRRVLIWTVNVPAGVIVDARCPNLYEAENGSHINIMHILKL